MKSKMIIYKSPYGSYLVTPKSNYDKYIWDSSKVNSYTGFKSYLQLIDFLCRYRGYKESDFIILDS